MHKDIVNYTKPKNIIVIIVTKFIVSITIAFP